MDISQTRDYFVSRCNELASLAERGDPWVFLCASAMIDYLAHMTTGKSGRSSYIGFIEDYFKKINPNYKDFAYQNGETDLPIQMYVILRCGIVHKYSFIPNDEGKKYGGRERSILLAHEINGLKHLTAFTKNGMDSVIFTAEQFTRDLKSVVEMIFDLASSDKTLEASILKYVSEFPPIMAIQD